MLALGFTGRQIMDARKITAYDHLRSEDDRFESEKMHQHRSRLAAQLLKDLDNPHPDYSKYERDAEPLLDYFEAMGLMLRKGIVPKEYLWTLESYEILRYWQILSGYMRWSRVSEHDDTFYSEFDYMYRQLLKVELEKRKKANLILLRPEIRDFLQSEKEQSWENMEHRKET